MLDFDTLVYFVRFVNYIINFLKSTFTS